MSYKLNNNEVEIEEEQGFTEEDITAFMDGLNEHDRAVFDDIVGGVYMQGKHAGENKQSGERTTFSQPFIDNIGQLLLDEDNEELAKSYDEGMKVALKYAGMVNVLASVGVSMEAIETIVINDMAIKAEARYPSSSNK